MAARIADTASIDSTAEIDDDVEIGPFSVIGAHARILSGTRLLNSVTIMGNVTIGHDNVIYPNVVIGGEPQDISYAGSDTQVVIGDGNIIREGVTINRGSEKEDGITRLGDKNFLMACCHIAHDCKLGDHIIIANGSLLGGHVHVEDYASLSGAVAVHHFTTIGSYSFVGGLSRVLHDVPPFMLCEGAPARPRCINIVALKRHEFTTHVIDSLAEAHRLIYRAKVGVDPAREILRGNGQLVPQVKSIVRFCGRSAGRPTWPQSRGKESSVNPLRVAVIGAGHLGRIHARIAAGLEEIELVAVADPVESCRNGVAQEANTKSVADFRELIGDIDAAIIATPTTYHHAIAMELLGCGLPLLIEKPITVTSQQAHELVTLARQKDVTLQVGHVERFNPALTAVAADVRDPKYIDATRTSGYTFRSTDIGVVMDIMIHDLDIVLSLAKSTVEDVQALGISVLGSHEDMATARLTFASGCVANLTASRVSFQQKRSMSIFTSRGSASINFATFEATVVKPSDAVLRREFRAEQLSAEERAYWKENVFTELLVRSQRDAQPVNAIQEEQRDFVAAVRTGRPPRVDGAAGRDAIAVAELILERMEEHAWDGTTNGRHGALAMPALPIIAGTTQSPAGRTERRRAG